MSQGGKNGDKGLPVHRAAKRLGLTPQYVRQLIREGKLPAVRESPRKTWVPESALEAFREEQ